MCSSDLQSMEWRNGIAWMPPLTYVVDMWLLLAGGTSAIARLTLTDYVVLFFFTRPVAATGRRQLRSRPVEFVILFYFRYSTVAVTGRKYLRPRPADCTMLFSFTQLWLSLVGSISVLARLISLFYFIYSTCGCYWLETSPPSPG